MTLVGVWGAAVRPDHQAVGAAIDTHVPADVVSVSLPLEVHDPCSTQPQACLPHKTDSCTIGFPHSKRRGMGTPEPEWRSATPVMAVAVTR